MSPEAAADPETVRPGAPVGPPLGGTDTTLKPVGSPRSRMAKIFAARAFNAGASSTESAKRALAAVYSWAQ